MYIRGLRECARRGLTRRLARGAVPYHRSGATSKFERARLIRGYTPPRSIVIPYFPQRVVVYDSREQMSENQGRRHSDGSDRRRRIIEGAGDKIEIPSAAAARRSIARLFGFKTFLG